MNALKPLREPFRGLKKEGTIQAGFVPAPGDRSEYCADHAGRGRAFPGALSAGQRQRAVFPLDSEERRNWLNVHPSCSVTA